MAILYGAWASQGTVRAQYDMLCLHLSELQTSGIGAGDINADGKGRANFSAVTNLSTLLKQKEAYEAALGIGLAATRVAMTGVRKRT
ncbi:MAG TPA: hypothetical protein VFF65_07655 [Phycisphaerales bacterium]|nr:hypothetical protein [Phycisphaerales bacterium]